MDFDLHIHSNWSQDNLDGPKMDEYIPLAKKYNFHIGFADHFELQYYNKYGGGPRKNGDSKWRLNPSTIEKYLEEIDSLKQNYSFVSSGLELDYYSEKKMQLLEFIDDYYEQFDLILGSVHETENYRPVTVIEDFNWLVENRGGFSKVLEKYWQLMFEMVSDQIFDAIGHPDVIYRFFSREDAIEKHPEYLEDGRVLDLGKECQKTKTLMEVNTSGFLKPWKSTFPKEKYIYNLYADGTRFIIGSDSHKLSDFEKSIIHLRKVNNIIRTRIN